MSMVKVLNIVVPDRLADFINFHIGLQQKLPCPLDAQPVQICDEGAAALFGKAGAEVFFVESHIVGHRL